VNYPLASIASNTRLTLAFSAGNQTSVPYSQASSPWDGNKDSTGYPCFDQIGRGGGHLLANPFPTAVDPSATSGGLGTVTLGAGGSDYRAGDVLGVTQRGASDGKVTVSTVGTGGTVTALRLTTAGSSYSIANGLSTTNVAGSLAGAGTTINVTGLISFPNQTLEPVYVWNNTYSPPPNNPYALWATWPEEANVIVENRDYYLQMPNGAESGIFNGRIPPLGPGGVGKGDLASRPSNCDPLVAYWATDTNTLYQCSATNTWTVYYTPYTYPHPLTLSPAPTD